MMRFSPGSISMGLDFSSLGLAETAEPIIDVGELYDKALFPLTEKGEISPLSWSVLSLILHQSGRSQRAD
jgi:hypothetical protein